MDNKLQTRYDYKDFIFLEEERIEGEKTVYNVYKYQSDEIINIAALIIGNLYTGCVGIEVYNKTEVLYHKALNDDKKFIAAIDKFQDISLFFNSHKRILNDICKILDSITCIGGVIEMLTVCGTYKDIIIISERNDVYNIYRKEKDENGFSYIARLKLGEGYFVLENKNYVRPSLYMRYNVDKYIFTDSKIMGIIYHHLKP